MWILSYRGRIRFGNPLRAVQTRNNALCRLPLAVAVFSFLLVFLAGSASGQEAATQSPHGILNEALACTDCHTETSWTPLKEPVDFNHGEVSGFQLLGRHRQAECSSCHSTLDFAVLEPAVQTQCDDCHEDIHAGELSLSCSNCHNEESFLEIDGLLIHSGTTFPLIGAHVQTTCDSCHRNGDRTFQTALDPSCDSCHLPDYESARTVDHVAADFPLQCQNCHNEYVWNGVIFDHLLVSNGFELVGAHEGLSCSNCHAAGASPSIFGSVAQNDCFSCHQPDYNEEHAGTGFPTTCTDCHSVDTWEGADFDHAVNADGFELLGAHAPLACESCHVQPGFDLIFTPTDQNDCISCHQTDYDGEHGGSGIPTTCLDCHNDVDFSETSFDHDADFFPIHSGEHFGEWSNCQDCHNNAVDFSVFTCLSCHAHEQSEMDDKHDDISAYIYESIQCLTCHPSGEK